MLRLRTPLTDDEFSALQVLANREMRDLGEQARFIIRKELERLGLLRSEEILMSTEDSACNVPVVQEASNG